MYAAPPLGNLWGNGIHTSRRSGPLDCRLHCSAYVANPLVTIARAFRLRVPMSPVTPRSVATSMKTRSGRKIRARDRGGVEFSRHRDCDGSDRKAVSRTSATTVQQGTGKL